MLSAFYVRKISPSLVAELSVDGKLLIMDVNDGHPDTLLDWYLTVKETLEAWPSDVPCFMLHDLHRIAYAAFNAQMQMEFLDLSHFRPELERHVAVILPEGLSASVAELDFKMREIQPLPDSHVHSKVFTRRKPALHWLIQQDHNLILKQLA